MAALSAFGVDVAVSFIGYLPLVAGAYISVLILRYPDLTIEASWSLAGIVACSVAKSLPPLWGLAAAIPTGAICGLLTTAVFVMTGRSKLLAGLISYFTLEAVGFHVLGNSASVFLDHSRSGFGFPDSNIACVVVYLLCSTFVFLAVVAWQRSLWGKRARLLGENPPASKFFRISLDMEFGRGLILSNALVGFGGGLWALYYGSASNVQGIGLVLKAFLALLLGNELLLMLRPAGRANQGAIVVGTALLVVLSNVTEAMQVRLAHFMSSGLFRPTDKQIVIAAVLVGLLVARRRRAVTEDSVSEW